jgi:cholesterol oxidase
MAVAQGAGVGGGSLCYSSVLLPATPELFGPPWPPEITHSELQHHYAKVSEMLAPRPVPDRQQSPRHRLLYEGAVKMGQAARFASAPLAVSFDEDFQPDAPSAIDVRSTKPFLNPHGQWQGTCVHLGNCDIGCDVRAKNTLDLNYLPRAERCGAEIRPLHFVRSIAPEGGGYRVSFDRIDSGRLRPGSEWAPTVVLAAGSLGSTELLLRCRDVLRTLPGVSPRLGHNWSANGNFLCPALYDDPQRVRQGIGPTISAAINLLGGEIDGQPMILEDDGFPNIWLNVLRQLSRSPWLSPLRWALLGNLGRGRDEQNPLAHVMVWLGAGKDAGDGRLKLARRIWAPWSRKLALDWNVARSRSLIDAIVKAHGRMTEATGGHLQVPLFWRVFRWLITVHPLGGCAMSVSPNEGVVSHTGEVFGYPRLFVSDGAAFPGPVGLNPSMTIAALAERTSRFVTGAR